jgi:hypothetical protein
LLLRSGTSSIPSCTSHGVMERAAMWFARHQPDRALATKLGEKVSENHEQASVSFASAWSAGLRETRGQRLTIRADVLLP